MDPSHQHEMMVYKMGQEVFLYLTKFSYDKKVHIILFYLIEFIYWTISYNLDREMHMYISLGALFHCSRKVHSL
jgi:hypothetical protein